MFLFPHARGLEKILFETERVIMLSSLTVAIPAYNEEKSLKKVVNDIRERLPLLAHSYEILIINDGSKDGTRNIANALAMEDACIKAIHHPFNIGYGGGQKSAILQSSSDYITIVPADEQFNPDNLFSYVEAIKDHDIVVGYRYYRRTDSIQRRINTFVFRAVMMVLFGITLRDTNWVKLFRHSIFNDMEITSRGICIDAELMFKAKLKGCRFKEIPVDYRIRLEGVSTGDKPLNVIITILELLYLRMSEWIKKRG